MTEDATSRRRFLTAAGAAALAATAAAACTSDTDEAAPSSAAKRYAYRGAHQSGITAPPAAAGLVAGLDVRATSREELAVTLTQLGSTIEHLMEGREYEDRAGGFPPADTGIVGPGPAGSGLHVIVGYGESLFDERFGLAEQRPRELTRMPKFANDYLVRPERSHGDLSVTVSADDADTVTHVFRQIMRETRGDLIPRWMREGYNTLVPDWEPGIAPGRNLLGFKDGTANPDANDSDLMDDLVWVADGDDEPAWTVGGTYQAIRVIRMMVEFWDRTRLNEQEALIGRHRDSGAPIGFDNEADTPVLADLESHIARANPRTPGRDDRIFRRGFNYVGGFDQNDQLDQGLIFLSFQRSLERGFIATQKRLDGEALEEYVRPLSGGFFFVPAPPADGEALGAALLA
ncbi:MAG: Dyp-type peroxidase [Actinomycetota bacterium]